MRGAYLLWRPPEPGACGGAVRSSGALVSPREEERRFPPTGARRPQPRTGHRRTPRTKANAGETRIDGTSGSLARGRCARGAVSAARVNTARRCLGARHRLNHGLPCCGGRPPPQELRSDRLATEPPCSVAWSFSQTCTVAGQFVTSKIHASPRSSPSLRAGRSSGTSTWTRNVSAAAPTTAVSIPSTVWGVLKKPARTAANVTHMRRLTGATALSLFSRRSLPYWCKAARRSFCPAASSCNRASICSRYLPSQLMVSGRHPSRSLPRPFYVANGHPARTADAPATLPNGRAKTCPGQGVNR